MPERPQPAGGVFLSYAREDTDAARRLAEAMRAFGIDAWFDQGELLGGEAWDAKIRKQIRECALFMPVISAATQARSEGYFRREWKLAVERTHDMAAGRAFLVPVVIDGTAESEALAPEEFMRVQWTRLPGGVLPAEFAAQVKRLLEAPRKPSLAAAPKPPMTTLPPFKPVAAARSTSRRPLIFGAVAALLIAGGVFWWLRQDAAATSIPRPAPVTALKVEDKSVAVLAFTNLSDDKANEYFSDGISEELLNVLAKVPGLKVTARTSSFHFKGKDTPIPEIARQLGVAYVVEGSVQRAGDSVRITAQLIKAADGYHVWSDHFDRELKNVFALQDEIAGLIAKNLSLKLGTKSAERAVNPEAYRLFLLGRAIFNRGIPGDYPEAIQCYKDSLAIDGDSALTWARLAMVYVTAASQGALPAEPGFALAHDAANRAIALDPESAQGHAALGTVQFIGDWDWAGADRSLQRALDLAPGDVSTLSFAANLAQTLGQTERGLEWSRKAMELDPLNFIPAYVLGKGFFQAGRFSEMEKLAEQMIATNPAGRYGHVFLTYARLQQGRIAAAARAIEPMKPDFFQLTCLALVRHAQGRAAESEAALNELKDRNGKDSAYQIAEVHAYRNEADQAFEWLEKAYREHDAGMTWMTNDPFMKNVRADARWRAMLKKMNLPDTQQK